MELYHNLFNENKSNTFLLSILLLFFEKRYTNIACFQISIVS